MLVVPARNQFVLTEKEDWPRANLLSHYVAMPLFYVQDFRGGRRLKAGEACDLVPRNQYQVHPGRPVRKDREEDFNDVSFRAAQRCAVRVTKVRAFNQGLAQGTPRGHVALDDTHPSLGTI